MKSDTNVFGQRICTRAECPLWYTGSEQCGCDGFCNALMDFTGRVAEIDGKVTYGLLRSMTRRFDPDEMPGLSAFLENC